MNKILFILVLFPLFSFSQWEYKRTEDLFKNTSERVAYIKSNKSSSNTYPTLVITRIEAVNSEKMKDKYQEDSSLPFRQYAIYLEDCYIGNNYSFQYLVKYGDGNYDRNSHIYLSVPNSNVIGVDGKNKDACYFSWTKSQSYIFFFEQIKKGSSLEIQISSDYGTYNYSFSLAGSTRAINYISSITRFEEKLKKTYQSKIDEEIYARKDLIPGVCDYQGYHIFTFPSSDRWTLSSYSYDPGFMFPEPERDKETGYLTGYARGGLSSLAPWTNSNMILDKMGLIHLKDNPSCIVGNLRVPYEDSKVIKSTGKRFPGFSSYKGFRLKHNCIPKNNPYYNESFDLIDIQ